VSVLLHAHAGLLNTAVLKGDSTMFSLHTLPLRKQGRNKLCHTMIDCTENYFSHPLKWPLTLGSSENSLHDQ